MDKNIALIRSGLKQLVSQPCEIFSGVVIEGSLDETALTIAVQPNGSGSVIDGVTINAIANQNEGVLLIPKDNSQVIVGSVDGSGEWTLLKQSEISKAIFTIGDVGFEISDEKVIIKNGSLVFDAGSEVFKINSASESLYQLLNDLISEIQNITVPTPSGPSSPPINTPMFVTLASRLSNLLTA